MERILAYLGFATIIYFLYKSLIILNDKKRQVHNLYNQKVVALRTYSFDGHKNEIKTIFDDFEKKQQVSRLVSDELEAIGIDYNKGSYVDVLGNSIYYRDYSNISNLQKNIREKVKELEATDVGKKMIQIAVDRHVKYENNYKLLIRYHALKLELNHIEYSKLIKSIFPSNQSIKLTKEQFVLKLKNINYFKDKDVDTVYEILTHPCYGIIEGCSGSYSLVNTTNYESRVDKLRPYFDKDLKELILNNESNMLPISYEIKS